MTARSSGKPRVVAVLDVGKTNVKAVLHDLATETDIETRTMPNAVRQDGPLSRPSSPRRWPISPTPVTGRSTRFR